MAGSWKQQYSVGDQSFTSRFEFWKGGFKKCVRCGGENIQESTDSAGCRHNGDGYGTAKFLCLDTGCGWVTSFLYDENTDDGPYYYETRGWRTKLDSAESVEATPKQYEPLTDTRRQNFIQLRNQTTDEFTRRQMELLNIDPGEIDRFLATPKKPAASSAPKIVRQELTEELCKKYDRIRRLIPVKDLIYNMEQEGISRGEIKRFLKSRGLVDEEKTGESCGMS